MDPMENGPGVHTSHRPYAVFPIEYGPPIENEPWVVLLIFFPDVT